jgi:hypothetical protein
LLHAPFCPVAGHRRHPVLFLSQLFEIPAAGFIGLWLCCLQHYAMSGGTLIAFAANEIVMSNHAVLGPIDPQLGQFPAASLVKVVEQKPISEIDDETLIKADVGCKAIAQLKQAAGFRPIRRRRWPRSSRPGRGRTTIRFEPPRPRNSAFPPAPTCLTQCSS